MAYRVGSGQTGAASAGGASAEAVATWLRAAELPSLLLAIVFSFLAARALSGGMFRREMSVLPRGFLVTGVAHLHMQVDRSLGFDLLSSLFGEEFSGLGSWGIYGASEAR
jgi:ABC-type antimicrobial peptide transport system permease subunit